MKKVQVTIDDVRRYEKECMLWLQNAPLDDPFRQRVNDDWRWCTNTILQYENNKAERRSRTRDACLKIGGSLAGMGVMIVVSNSELGARVSSASRGLGGNFFNRLI